MVIRQSFLFLLKEQAIEKITVADVCRLAEINRATFYRHYENQYSILYELESDLLDQVQVPPEVQSSVERITKAIGGLFEKKEEWLPLLASNPDPGLSARLYRFLSRHFPDGTDNRNHRFFLHGLSGLLSDWMTGGFSESQEEMTACAVQYFQDLTEAG